MVSKYFKKIFFVFITQLLCSTITFAQGLTCATATNLPLNAACVNSTITNTENGTLATGSPTCATGSSFQDVWYQIVGNGALINVTVSGSNTASSLAAYSGCVSGQISCAMIAAGASGSISFNSVLGTTYFIQVQRRSGTTNGDQTGNICAIYLPPVNDEPCSASPLTVGFSCSSTQGNNFFASSSPGVPAPACGFYLGGDVWFSAVVPVSGNIDIALAPSSITFGGFAIYSGTCSALTYQGCEIFNGASSNLTYTDLTPGSTVWIRVWDQSNDFMGTFDICVTEPAIPLPPFTPWNDQVCSAEPIPPATSCNYIHGVTTNATASFNGVPSCAGYDGQDVWYSYTVPASGVFVGDIFLTGSTTAAPNGGFQLYNVSCNALSPLGACTSFSSGGTSFTYTTVPGSTIWIRVWGNSATGLDIEFDLCVFEPIPPANDNPCSAIPITPGSDCNETVATNIYSTASFGVPAPGCGTNGGTNDVWFTVTVPASGALNLMGIYHLTEARDLEMSVYTGICSSLTLLACNDDGGGNGFGAPALAFTGLTPGITLWIRITATITTGDFGICATDPTIVPTPINDNCSGALDIPISGGNCENSLSGTLTGATVSPSIYGCADALSDDIWYSFTAPSNSVAVVIPSVSFYPSAVYLSIYNGNCATLGTEIQCGTINSVTTQDLIVNGLTIGNTYFVRVQALLANSLSAIDFDICITPAMCGHPMTEDYCATPATIVQGPGTLSGATGSYSSDTPANLLAEFCATIQNNSWFEFTALNTTEIFDFTVISCTGGAQSMQAHVYEVIHDVNGCCTNLSSVSNCNNNMIPGFGGIITATGLTVGNQYILMIDGNANSSCSYSILDWVSGIPLGTEIQLFTAVPLDRKNEIIWETVSEKNNDYFKLLRSYDGINFNEIGIIDGNGTSNELIRYSYLDEIINTDVIYYQLIQVDFNGLQTPSNIISVGRNDENNTGIYVWPNPITDNPKIVIYGAEGGTLKLLDVTGKIIQVRDVAEKNHEFEPLNVEQLKPGVYSIVFTSSTGLISNSRIVKL